MHHAGRDEAELVEGGSHRPALASERPGALDRRRQSASRRLPRHHRCYLANPEHLRDDVYRSGAGAAGERQRRRPAERRHGVVDEATPYGRIGDLSHLSKVYAEKLLEMYALTRGLRCLALRFGVVYGLSPVLKTDERFMTAPNKFCRQAARGEPLTVHGGGRTLVGWVHVADAARAALAAAGHHGFTGYAPLNVVGEVASLATLAGYVREAGAARGLSVRIDGLDADGAAGDGADAPAFTVSSGLDALPLPSPAKSPWPSTT